MLPESYERRKIHCWLFQRARSFFQSCLNCMLGIAKKIWTNRWNTFQWNGVLWYFLPTFFFSLFSSKKERKVLKLVGTDSIFLNAHCILQPWRSFSTNQFVRWVYLFRSCFGKVVFCRTKVFHRKVLHENMWTPMFFRRQKFFCHSSLAPYPLCGIKLLVTLWKMDRCLHYGFNRFFADCFHKMFVKNFQEKLSFQVNLCIFPSLALSTFFKLMHITSIVKQVEQCVQ